MRIYTLKNGRLNEEDRLEMAKLLIKAGYTVRIGKEKSPNKRAADIYVEFREEWGIETDRR